MRKAIRFATFVLIGAAVVALAVPASHAACTNSRPIIGNPTETEIDFGLANADVSPFDGVPVIQASYWRFGAGNPAVGAGADNGNWLSDGANGGPWFADFSSNGHYFTVGLTDLDGTSDGCINGANDGGGDADDDVLLAACAPDGKFFVVAGTNADLTVYNFGLGPYTAANSPQILVTSSVRVLPGIGTGVQIFFSTPSASDFSASFFDNGSGLTVDQVFTGVNVYTACVPRGNSSPGRIVPDPAWTLAGSFALGAVAQSVSVDCGPGTWDVFVGTEPKFDGATPFTAGCVTGTTRPVQAGTTLANPSDEAPRTIKKPRTLRPANPN